MITLDDRSTGRVFGFHVNGKLTRDDYRRFLPRLEEAIKKHGRIRVLVHIESLSGFELGALWEELKFDVRHIRHLQRVALVGDKKWHERSTALADHLTPVNAKYFPSSALAQAWAWIMEDEPAQKPGGASEGAVRSILLATDFSENATTAMSWASTIAKAHGAPVSVLHVAREISNASLPLQIQDGITQSLRALEDVIRNEGVEVTTRWKEGRPWEVIAAEARDHDLVVIGARGHTPLLHITLGSTADRVIRSATVPVLTVHRDGALCESMPRRLIVPTDFSELATLALDTAIRVFGITSAQSVLDITLLHAWQPLVDDSGGSILLPPNPVADSPDQARELLRKLAARVAAPSIRVTSVVQHGHPSKVIEEEADTIDAQVIAMGTHGHSGLARFMLGSVTERVIRRVHCAVLSAPPASQAVEDAREARAGSGAAVVGTG